LGKVPWTAEKNVPCATTQLNIIDEVLYRSLLSSFWSMLSLHNEVSLLNFFFFFGLDDLSIGETGVVKYSTVLFWGQSLLLSPVMFA
jgi:hypothetical protein